MSERFSSGTKEPIKKQTYSEIREHNKNTYVYNYSSFNIQIYSIDFSSFNNFEAFVLKTKLLNKYSINVLLWIKVFKDVTSLLNIILESDWWDDRGLALLEKSLGERQTRYKHQILPMQ